MRSPPSAPLAAAPVRSLQRLSPKRPLPRRPPSQRLSPKRLPCQCLSPQRQFSKHPSLQRLSPQRPSARHLLPWYSPPKRPSLSRPLKCPVPPPSPAKEPARPPPAPRPPVLFWSARSRCPLNDRRPIKALISPGCRPCSRRSAIPSGVWIDRARRRALLREIAAIEAFLQRENPHRAMLLRMVRRLPPALKMVRLDKAARSVESVIEPPFEAGLLRLSGAEAGSEGGRSSAVTRAIRTSNNTLFWAAGAVPMTITAHRGRASLRLTSMPRFARLRFLMMGELIQAKTVARHDTPVEARQDLLVERAAGVPPRLMRDEMRVMERRRPEPPALHRGRYFTSLAWT